MGMTCGPERVNRMNHGKKIFLKMSCYCWLERVNGVECGQPVHTDLVEG